jgi:hypothetical protein
VTEVVDLNSYEDLHKIVEWTKAWYEQAVEANFVSPPYQADQDTLTRLHQYYRAGLTPDEAIQACFGPKH